MVTSITQINTITKSESPKQETALVNSIYFWGKEEKKMLRAMKKVLACAIAAALTLGTVNVASAATESPVVSVKPEKKEDVKVSVGKVDTKKDGTAAIATIKNKKTVTISANVTVDGVKYAVTTIKANAFKNATKVTKVTLPKTIKVINKNAFAGAKKLKTITLKGTKSITVKKGAFKGLKTKKMTIKVSKKMSKKQLTKLKKALKKAGFKGKVKKA